MVMPTAYVLIKCKDGAQGRITSNLGGKDTIREIQPTVGHYDFVAKITSPDIEHLDQVIGEIHYNDKVRSTKILRLNESLKLDLYSNHKESWQTGLIRNDRSDRKSF
jgi:DNA-binding Lrp family transcriptional regulator